MNKILNIYSVIEMNPWDIENSVNLKENEDFGKFAINVFNNAGMKSINRLDKHAYSSIILSDINNEDLSVLLKHELNDADILENGIESVGDFAGGLVITFKNDGIIKHSCCGGISNYQNWLYLIENKPKDWTEIWIGHPFLYAKVKGNSILITEYLETLPEKNEFKFEVDFLEFKEKLYIASTI